MNLFQILALVVLAGLLLVTCVAIRRGWASRREGLLWALLWFSAGVAVAVPAVTTIVARALGIHRGADLVLYCAVVAMLAGFLMVYVRLRRLQCEITLLVRHLAIRDATVAPPAKHPGEAAPSREERER